MPSQFESMMKAAGAPMLDQQFGVTVTLVAGENSTEAFTARRSDYKGELDKGSNRDKTKVVKRTYRFAASSVVIEGNVVAPKPGFKIIDGGETFKVMQDGDMPAVQSQLSGQEWLVMTKQMVD